MEESMFVDVHSPQLCPSILLGLAIYIMCKAVTLCEIIILTCHKKAVKTAWQNIKLLAESKYYVSFSSLFDSVIGLKYKWKAKATKIKKHRGNDGKIYGDI